MLKANELKNQQKVKCIFGKNVGIEFTVISNHIGDVLFLCNVEADFYQGFHLFYDDPEDVAYALLAYGIDLS